MPASAIKSLKAAAKRSTEVNRSDYKFPVSLHAVKAVVGQKMILVDNRKAVVRTDKNVPLGIVSDKYKLINHSTAVDAFRTALKGHKTEETIKMTNNGARMHMEVVLPEIKVTVNKGDSIALRLIIKNSYDSSQGLQIVFGAFRLVCSNGMIIGRKFISFNRKHIGEATIELDEVTKQVEYLIEMFKKQEPVMRKMVTAKLTPSPEVFFNAKALKIDKYLVDIAKEKYMAESLKTVWSAYNALTSAITHDMKKERLENSINYGRQAWLAASELVK